MSEQKHDSQTPLIDVDFIINTPNDDHASSQHDTNVNLDDFFKDTATKTSDTDFQDGFNHVADDGSDTYQINTPSTDDAHQHTSTLNFDVNFDNIPLATDVISENTALDDTIDADNLVEHKGESSSNEPTNPETSIADNALPLAAAGTLAGIGANTPNNENSDKPTNTKKSGFFGKKTKSSTTTDKPFKANQAGNLLNDSKKLNMLILIGVLVIAISAALIYINFSGNTTDTPTPTASPVADTTPISTPETVATDTPASATLQNDILPDVGKNAVNPDEILNAQIPSDPALVKEEIDRLADTDKQLNEQSKLIKEQLTMMEDLTTAKAEQIALLEAQIAELEKQKNAANPAASQPQSTK